MTQRLVAVLLGALVMAGCSAEADPTPEPSSVTTEPSPESTTVPSRPAVSAPEPPPEMSRADAEGAQAAAEYFLTLVPYVYATGDLERWNTMSAAECGYCRSIRTDVEALFEDGGYVTEAVIHVSAEAATEVDTGSGVYLVEVEVEEPPSKRVEDSSHVISQDGGEYSASVAVWLEGAQWKIGAVEGKSE